MGRGKHAWIHQGFPFVGIGVGQAVLKLASSKVAKHKKTYIKNQHNFILFASDTFVFLASKVV